MIVHWEFKFLLHFPIHQKIEAEWFWFAGQIRNCRPLWVSPDQYTKRVKFRLRAFSRIFWIIWIYCVFVQL